MESIITCMHTLMHNMTTRYIKRLLFLLRLLLLFVWNKLNIETKLCVRAVRYYNCWTKNNRTAEVEKKNIQSANLLHLSLVGIRAHAHLINTHSESKAQHRKKQPMNDYFIIIICALLLFCISVQCTHCTLHWWLVSERAAAVLHIFFSPSFAMCACVKLIIIIIYVNI